MPVDPPPGSLLRPDAPEKRVVPRLAPNGKLPARPKTTIQLYAARRGQLFHPGAGSIDQVHGPSFLFLLAGGDAGRANDTRSRGSWSFGSPIQGFFEFRIADPGGLEFRITDPGASWSLGSPSFTNSNFYANTPKRHPISPFIHKSTKHTPCHNMMRSHNFDK